jgi:hypothetical protein
VIKVPWTGKVFTSSRRSTGYGIDHFYFVAGDGKRTPLKENSHGCLESELRVQQFEYYSSPYQATVFFVGTKHELSGYKRPEVK